jgi:nitrate reductase NapAB chaperone NapD
VLVGVEPERIPAALEALAAIEGAEVHQIDELAARAIVVLESDDRTGQERLFRALQALPGVRSVELTHHWIDTEPGGEPSREEKA